MGNLDWRVWGPVALALSGCGSESGRMDSTGFGSVTAATSPETGIGSSGADEDGLDLGNGETSGSGPIVECDEIVDTATIGPRSQDIIFAVDTSASMVAESGFVQEQMNSFSIQIDAANVDARIILLAEYPNFGGGVCIDPPLGSGGCPTSDSNPPEFLHVPDSDIGSSNSLSRLIELFPQYAPFVRPTSLAHVVVVSDDNSAMSAADFTSGFSALAPHLSQFVFHGIISSEDPDNCPNSCCGFMLAAEQGTVYQELIAQTGGVEGNLCEQEFSPVFAAVAQQVISGATLSCAYEIPPPPEGETFDRDQVNVAFDDGAGGSLEIGRVDDVSECASVSDGWYYDDPTSPSLILVCPQTCDEIQGFTAGSVAIKFGCETIPAG